MYPSHPGTQWHWPFTWWINSILFNTFHLAPTKGQCTWDWIVERAVCFCSTQPSELIFMIRSNWLSCANPSNWGWGVNYYMYRTMYCIDFIPQCGVSGCQPRSVQELDVSSILKMCCPGCSSASCSPLSAPSMDQRGGGEWLCCSSLHRANATYALAQSLRFFCLGEEPSDNDTPHTVKGKCHGIFLSSADCKTL